MLVAQVMVIVVSVCACVGVEAPDLPDVLVNWHHDVHLNIQLLNMSDAPRIITSTLASAKVGQHGMSRHVQDTTSVHSIMQFKEIDHFKPASCLVCCKQDMQLLLIALRLTQHSLTCIGQEHSSGGHYTPPMAPELLPQHDRVPV